MNGGKIIVLSTILFFIALYGICGVTAFMDPYGMDGYVKDKEGTGLVGANITFNNTDTNEQIYFTSVTNGAYSQNALNFPSEYSDGDTITYYVIYNGTEYLNESYYHTINISEDGPGNTVNLILDQAPTVATSYTDLGMNLVNHTPTITWTKGTDPDSGDTVTTYIYVGSSPNPTTEEGNNTGTTIDLGSTVSLTDGNTYYYRLRSYDGERWSNYTVNDTFRMNSVPNTSAIDIQGEQEIQHITDHTPNITWSYNDNESDDQGGYNVTVWTGTGGTGTLMGTSSNVSGNGTSWNYSGSALVDGTTYYALVCTNDTYEWSAWNETSFRMNSLPTVSSVQISPGDTNTTSTLTGNGTYADNETDSESGTTYKWFKNDAEIEGETNLTLSGTNFIKNDGIIFQYTPNDGYENGTAVNSSEITIGNINVTLDSIGAKNVDDKEQVSVDGNGTDQDVGDGVDTLTFSCNRTDLFNDFNTGTGVGTWIPFYNQTGVYYIDFGVTDGTSTDNETVTVTVSDVTYNTGLFSGYNLLSWIGETNGSAYELSSQVPNGSNVVQKNDTTGNYETFNPSIPEINNFTTVKGKGYFVYTTDTDPFSRSRIDAVQYNTLLPQGYSIVGWSNVTSWNASSVATDIGANCSAIVHKNETTGNYETFNPSIPEINNFDVDVGIGYYLYVTNEMVWERNE